MRDILNTPMITHADDLLTEAEQALHKGMIHDAYELSLQATQAEPENGEAWLLRAGLTDSLEEKVLCVNHMNELGMRYDDRHHLAFFTLKEVLDHDPFLAYAEETEELYRVRDAERTLLSIPKKRSVTVPYPSDEKPDALALSHRLLLFAILGLLFAGIGTLIFAPLAAWAAFEADHSKRIESLVIAFSAMGLLIIGIFFSILLFLHWMG